ncbi:acid protease [Cucurbitaria berberidis CBS 394.84]|uniref:Acid protease n=1 Tax=Cucurbitaria berberidis CBS 394.84 TaxID=1168544 RepID=A0A9P4LC16_9PLEO|nr:acid protease [Cucurbitaria berberidis CBS 394.84]KAF1849590.1 acid protease [Cucurbitaria berberidis CBS 394.84]
MRTSLSTWLAFSAAAALLPTATAFYPYQYGDDSKSSSSSSNSNSRLRRIPLPPSTSNANSNNNVQPITLPLRRVPSPLRARQNTYNIVNSNDPKQEKSVAIDQDGRDISYMVAVTFGDSKEEYHLLLDTAASNTWVMSQECSSSACKTHNTFGAGDSSTVKPDSSKSFSVTYGTGSVSGTLATDMLHIGALSPTLTFGLATTVSQEFRSYPMDGILGIGRGTPPTTSGSIAAPQVMDVLSTSNLIGAKLYGIHLSRAKDGKLDGELDLGAVNKDRFSGELNWLSAVDNDRGFWEVQLEDAGVDGKTLGLSGRTAIMDTGTSYILVPRDDALAMHSQISGFKQDGETFGVPCEATAVIQFSFNKQGYNISTADWVGAKIERGAMSGLCMSNIIGRQTFSDKQWLVGDVFLKNVYSVFDADEKRVGLGVKGSEDVDKTGEASSTTMSSAASGESTSTSTTMQTWSNALSATGASKTANSSSGGASPTAPAEGQPQGQNGQSGAVGRASAPLLGLTVAGVTLLSLFI